MTYNFGFACLKFLEIDLIAIKIAIKKLLAYKFKIKADFDVFFSDA